MTVLPFCKSGRKVPQTWPGGNQIRVLPSAAKQSQEIVTNPKGISFFFLNQLEANYFTVLQWFLSYVDMNQPWIYMYSPSRLRVTLESSSQIGWVNPNSQDPKPHERRFEVDGGEKSRVDSIARADSSSGTQLSFPQPQTFLCEEGRQETLLGSARQSSQGRR